MLSTSEPRGDGAATVDEALGRYDRTLTALLRDPTALVRPDDQVLAAWTATISPGAVLLDDVRDLVAGHLAGGRRVEPPEGRDRSYSHRAVTAEWSGADVIEFTWCGVSPGVVRNASTGSVLDDGLGHATGSGRLRRTGDTWLVDSLDEATIEILPADSPDPCREPHR